MESASEQLGRFVGEWNTEGFVYATGDDPGVIVKGTDSYEWLPGNFFLLHKVDVMMGDDTNQTFEIIGYDGVQKRFTLQYYDNKGNSGQMTATVTNDEWIITGETLQFKGRFNTIGNEFSGVWEKHDEALPWKPFMDIKLTRSSII